MEEKMSVEIKKLNYLDDSIIGSIRHFENVCKEYDGLAGEMDLGTSMNFDKQMRNVFLLYEGEKLVSALSIFAPRKAEGEVYGYTLPEYRRKGYFKKLLSEAAEELKAYGVEDFLFICERKSTDGNAMIEKMKVQWDHGEHLMAYHGDKPFQTEGRLKLHMVDRNDLKTLVEMNMSVFSDYYRHPDELMIKMSNILDSKEREMYMGFAGDKPVGICSVGMEQEDPSIYGFGIMPAYRRRRYGEEFMKLVMNNLIKRNIKTIKLDVNYENSPAINLYLKIGFETEASFGYFRKKL
jgi:ribosomal protein S18 acetylase RimI-like enzyme